MHTTCFFVAIAWRKSSKIALAILNLRVEGDSPATSRTRRENGEDRARTEIRMPLDDHGAGARSADSVAEVAFTHPASRQRIDQRRPTVNEADTAPEAFRELEPGR